VQNSEHNPLYDARIAYNKMAVTVMKHFTSITSGGTQSLLRSWWLIRVSQVIWYLSILT